jgi:hypothetical protein
MAGLGLSRGVVNDGGGSEGGRKFEIQGGRPEEEGGVREKRQKKKPSGHGGTGHASGLWWLPRVWNSYSIPRV